MNICCFFEKNNNSNIKGEKTDMDKKAQNKTPLIKKKIYEIPQTEGRNVEDPAFPIVNDPPVPNRAHTELRKDFPPEFPKI